MENNQYSIRPQNLNFGSRIPKVSCIKCKKEMGVNNFAKHNDRRCIYWSKKAGIIPRGTAGGWNKGLTKETDQRVSNIAKINSKRKKGKPGRFHSEETKDKLSKIMKTRHENGTAPVWCRSKGFKSYPEEFFEKVIKNEFSDTQYEFDYPFDKFRLDFAWVSKKKVIEIDGEQHERLEEQIRRDREKDQKLKEAGWDLLRIRWKDMHNDTKKYIQKAKKFIDG